MSDICYVEVPESKLLYYVFKFLQPAIYTPNVYEGNSNCFCPVDFRTLPLKSYHVINQKSVIRNYQKFCNSHIVSFKNIIHNSTITCI